jgi:hypothetical protein
LAEALVRLRLQDNLPAGCGERQRALGGDDGWVIRTHEAEILEQKK